MNTHIQCHRKTLWHVIQLFIILTIALFIALWVFPSYAQSNQFIAPAILPNQPATPSQTSPATIKVADDVRQLVLDLFSLLSGVSWSGAALAAYLAIKGVRNRTTLGTGKLAPILNLLNLEARADFSQPQKTSTPDQPAQTTKPQ